MSIKVGLAGIALVGLIGAYAGSQHTRDAEGQQEDTRNAAGGVGAVFSGIRQGAQELNHEVFVPLSGALTDEPTGAPATQT